MKLLIDDIANKADVSVMTVSRILNNKKGHASKSVRERVMNIAKEFNYIPHGPAVSLVTQRTKMIGLIVPDISNPIYPVFVNGLHDTIKEEGYHFLLGNTYGDSNEEFSILKMFLRNRVDGLIILSLESKQDEVTEGSIVRLLRESGVPIVLSGRTFEDLKVDQVMSDSTRGAYLVVRHLLDLGHRRIGHIRGPYGVPAADLRLKGYQMALEEHGITFDESLIIESTFKQESGYRSMKEFMKMKCPPTAIFAANDIMALGAMLAIQEEGLRIPDDISIVGFDNIPLCDLVNPGLTTVAQPEYESGKKAAELILRRISEKINSSYDGKREEIILEPNLVVRLSTRRL